MFSREAIRRILAGAAVILLASAITAWLRSRRGGSSLDIAAGSSTEFPELRAHVYFAGAAAVLSAAGTAVAGVPGAARVTTDAASVRAELTSGRSTGAELRVDALPLGPRHTRAVVGVHHRSPAKTPTARPLPLPWSAKPRLRAIKAVQAAMDAILIGG